MSSATKHDAVGPCPVCWAWAWRLAADGDQPSTIIDYKRRQYVCRLCEADRAVHGIAGEIGQFGIALSAFYSTEAAQRISGSPGFELFRAQALEAINKIHQTAVSAAVTIEADEETEDGE